jgi:RNA polymerase-binding protein DksA
MARKAKTKKAPARSARKPVKGKPAAARAKAGAGKRGAGIGAGTKAKAARAAAAKKAAAKAARRKPASKKTKPKKSAAKKAVAKKATAKKGTAKKPAGKTAAARKGAKKVPAKKTAAKAKKTVGKKVAAKPAKPAKPAKKPAPPKPEPELLPEPIKLKKSPYSRRELKPLRQALMVLRTRLVGDIDLMGREALRADEADVDAENMADHGTDAFERNMTLELMENESRTLRQIDEALETMNAGYYGNCIECGDSIVLARLEALPFARTCVPCQEVQERSR